MIFSINARNQLEDDDVDCAVWEEDGAGTRARSRTHAGRMADDAGNEEGEHLRLSPRSSSSPIIGETVLGRVLTR